MSFTFILPHNSTVPEPGECRAAYVVYMWIVSHPCWNFLCGATEHFWHQCLCLTPENRHFCSPYVHLSILFDVCHMQLHILLLHPQTKVLHWWACRNRKLKRFRARAEGNLREIPGAMDTPGGIWCKESVICTSNTPLNQSQASSPWVL